MSGESYTARVMIGKQIHHYKILEKLGAGGDLPPQILTQFES